MFFHSYAYLQLINAVLLNKSLLLTILPHNDDTTVIMHDHHSVLGVRHIRSISPSRRRWRR
jgi:hypothetical protein